MSDIADVTVLVRNLVEDFARTSAPGDIFTYTSSSIFTISEPNVIAVTSVLVNSVSIATYTYNSTRNQVTISSSLTSGDTVEIQYTYYANYSDSEIEAFIRSAIVHISVNNYKTWETPIADDNFYPDITDEERNLIAVITSILMKPDNVSYRLPDFSINVPNSLPTRDIISQTIRKFKFNGHGHFEIIGTIIKTTN